MVKQEILDEIKNLQLLLDKEKCEDLAMFQQSISASSISERRMNGVCWYPVSFESYAWNSGEQLIIRISRPSEHFHNHQFQSGKLVNIFSITAGKNTEGETLSGVVNYVRFNEMTITLNAEDIPDWFHNQKLGVQLLFDENTYREMEKALNFLISTKDERINKLMWTLLGNAEPEFADHFPIQIPHLNKKQNEALNNVLSAKDVAIIHGPPGTGKTTTLIESILQTLKIENQVMVCAPSNAAVDLLVEKLSERNVNVVRIGHPARVTESILNQTLDARIANHDKFKDLKKYRKLVEEYRKLAGKYKRNYGPEEREQRRLLITEIKKLNIEIESLEDYITGNILQNARVIACTLVGAANHVLKKISFATVFIDEAAQGLEPATWIPIIKSNRVIFAGDHCQLPPTIKSYLAAKGGLETTLFEKVINRKTVDVMLQEQYRMNTEIMTFSSRYFYKNELFANQSVATHKIFDLDLPVEFIDTAGCGFFEEIDHDTKSTFNKEEAVLLFKHLTMYLDELKNLAYLDNFDSIGIISPYRAQVTLLSEILPTEIEIPDEQKRKITINTVDSFQGQEKDIIYISLVRSNSKSEIGFLSDTRRMNVAMTRARKKLVVIGDSGTIAKHLFYNRFLDYINEINAYKSVYEILYQ